jgi:hypothetical protein
MPVMLEVGLSPTLLFAALVALFSAGCRSSGEASVDGGHEMPSPEGGRRDATSPRDAGPAPRDARSAAVDASRMDGDTNGDAARVVEGGGGREAGAPDTAAHVLRGAYAAEIDASPAEQMAALVNAVGPIDLENEYRNVTDSFPNAAEQDALDHDRTLVMSLSCSGWTTRDVANGMYKSEFTTLARAMATASVRDGQARLIVVRYFWEMNLPNGKARQGCLDSSYDTNGAFNPAQWILAWRYVYTIFHETVPNVKMFYCPGVGSAGTQEFAKYWPADQDAGVTYVDINGFDSYDHQVDGGTFQEVVSSGYSAASSLSSTIPIWIGETGASPIPQAAGYIDGQTRAMLAAGYPLVGAVLYFDADGTTGDWILTDAGLAGFRAFGP